MKTLSKEMRAIKFRGLRIDGKGWVYGSLITVDAEPIIMYRNRLGVYKEYEVKYETVGQFTGLLDKSGAEIYEGDILLNKFKAERAILYKPGQFYFIHDKEEYTLNKFFASREDVIGNTHGTKTT